MPKLTFEEVCLIVLQNPTIMSHNIALLALSGASENRLIKVRPQQNVALKNGLPEKKELGEGVLKETPFENTSG